MKNKV